MPQPREVPQMDASKASIYLHEFFTVAFLGFTCIVPATVGAQTRAQRA